MDRQQKLNAKRCCQILLPSVPGPVVDYALNSPFLSSFASGSSFQSASSSDNTGSPGFAFRKMESGNWSELSLTSPKTRKHMKNNTFGKADKLSFMLAEPEKIRVGAQ